MDEVVLERPDRRGGAAADAGLLVDVLDVVPDGLGGDAEIVGDHLVRVPEHEREQHLELAPRQAGRQLAAAASETRWPAAASTASTASASSRPSSTSRFSSASAAAGSSAGRYGLASRIAV